MKMSARPECDVVALNTSDSVLVLLEVEAPERAPGRARPPATLEVVVDRSGSMTIRGGESVERVSVVGDPPASRLDDGALMVELGDFFSGESRRSLLRVSTAVLAEAGSRDDDEDVVLAKVGLTHVDPATLASYTDTLEVRVRVAWRVDRREADERVRAEELFQEARSVERRAWEAVARQAEDDASGAGGTRGRGSRLFGGRDHSGESFPDAPAGEER